MLWYCLLDDSHLLSYLTVLGVTHFCDVVLRSGTVANDVHFQAYLLEGIVRWNEDRAVAAVSSTDGVGDSRSYNDVLKAAANQLSSRLLGRNIDSGFRPANAYTGGHSQLLFFGFLFVTCNVL